MSTGEPIDSALVAAAAQMVPVSQHLGDIGETAPICNKCKGPDTSGAIYCELCGLCYHFGCAGIVESEDGKLCCSECANRNRRNVTTNRNLISIKLQELEEEKKIIERKYQLLSELLLDEENVNYNKQNVSENSFALFMNNLDCAQFSSSSTVNAANATAKFTSRNDLSSRVVSSSKPPVLPQVSVNYDPTPLNNVIPSLQVFSTQSHPPSISQVGNLNNYANNYSTQFSSFGGLPCASCTCTNVHSVRPSTSIFELNPNRQSDTAGIARVSSVNEVNLSSSQVAARQVMPKELPPFSGNPQEWPLFISYFEGSTRSCGFSNEENMYRLQRCLKGKALEAVRSLLLMPRTVPQVLDTLKLLYGRPELIINSLLQVVRSQPAPKADKLDSLVPFAITVQNLCATIEASGMTEHLHNPMLINELEEKLPPHIKLSWAIYKRGNPAVTLAVLGGWLLEMAKAASSVSLNTDLSQEQSTRHEKRSAGGFIHAHAENYVSESVKGKIPDSNQNRCLICEKGPHNVDQCNKFLRMSLNERWRVLKEKRLCRKCLCRHNQFKCKVDKLCGLDGCTFKHNQLLHSRNVNSSESPYSSVSLNTHRVLKTTTLFRVVPVVLHSETNELNTFAFLDEGSSLTLIEDSAIKGLGISGTRESLCLRWTGNNTRTEPNSIRISLQISGTHKGATKHIMNDVRSVSRLSLPNQSVFAEELCDAYPHLKDVKLQSFTDATPQILIGIDNWKLGLPLEVREGNSNEPVATRTRLGWVVHGHCAQSLRLNGSSGSPEDRNLHICECKSEKNLHELVKKYFLVDTLGVKIPDNLPESRTAKRAKHLLETTTRKIGSRYETGLLWKYDKVDFPDSYPMALQRLRCLERQVKNNPEIGKFIRETLLDHLNKGYIRKLNKIEIVEHQPRQWYLPIFVVTNPNKPGKRRLVWDAAAKVNQVSLNSFLLKGPDELTPLLQVLFQFRENLVAVTGDIKEMFHRVLVRPEDQHAQRFLYVDEESNIEIYVVQVMTFGATCSPSSAQFVKNLNAKSFAKEFPNAAKAILENHYVDDLLVSVEDVNEAITLANDIQFVHSQGGFEIRNWASNSPEVVEAMGESDISQLKMIGDKDTYTEKVLGMRWNTSNDCFQFALNLPRLEKDLIEGKKHPTKREVLRVLMSIFDPLGLLSHFTVRGKILMRDIWRSSIKWDERIPEELCCRWFKWLEALSTIKELRIPRCYTSIRVRERKRVELHIFVDASEVAFAAVAYIRVQGNSGIECTLVAAKTKVAPLKPTSIPRLELQAAVLGSRLANTIAASHSIKFNERFFWTDSHTVLSWIQSDPIKYKQYVAHRIGEILESTNTSEWRKVPTKLNVADEATKWVNNCLKLSTTDRWFTGPNFLQDDKGHWPENPLTVPQQPSEEEVTPLSSAHFETEPVQLIELSRFSNWYRLLRCMAFMLRFTNNVKSRSRRSSGPLTPQELELSRHKLCQIAQREFYLNDIEALKRNSTVSRSSSLAEKNPYLDTQGTLRARGRIDAAPNILFDTKHPIILPKDHTITRLIISSFHRRYHHHNHETVVNEVRQFYDIPGLRVLVRRTVRDCQQCKITKAIPNPPLMGDHPGARLASFTAPFTFVGLDYFGPIQVTVGRHMEKRWGALFTCLTIRAVHIEITYSLTTDSCIMAIRNFMARRGKPNEIHADNATNFHGAEVELRRELEKLDRNKLQEELFDGEPIKWVFNPPAAPHMGGAWERLVRSVKTTLKSITLQKNPCDETLKSMLMEVEVIVNSRPLTYVPLKTADQEALTPNHFLLGHSSGKKPPGNFSADPLTLRKNWKISQHFSDLFWKRWIREYLPVITKRTKWFFPVKPIQKGDVVVIVDENAPRNTWQRGLVRDAIPGRSGQVRQAIVQTAGGIFTRPATKLAVLDVRRDEPNEYGNQE